MGAEKLQEEISTQIKEFDDVILLKKIKSIMDNYSAEDKIYHLSDWEKKLIDEGTEAYEKGDYISHEEAMEQDRKWLSENE